MIITPTVGRKVWYWPSGTPVKGTQPNDATVAYVHNDRLINIGYRSHNGTTDGNHAVKVQLLQEGDEAPDGPYCTWMDYQLSQAKVQAEKDSAKSTFVPKK